MNRKFLPKIWRGPRAFAHQGSLYLGVTLLLIFLTIFMGIVLQQALLLSSLVRKKQEYSTQLYAADALAEYGVAYALEHYVDFYPESVDVKPELAAGITSKETRLVFERWPEHQDPAPYSGIITITKEDRGLRIACLVQKGIAVQRVSCVIIKAQAQGLTSPGRTQACLCAADWHRE